MTRTCLPLADALRANVGWNQTLDDWERYLVMEPDGCFVAERNGDLAGTATTIRYGTELGWIGMVLVDPACRRRGLGRRLVARCIEHLRHCGVQCIGLDATPDGRVMYERLGFKDMWNLTRWEHAGNLPQLPRRDARIRPWDESDLDAIDRLDSAAFGVSRRTLVHALAGHSRCALVLESAIDGTAGYGLLRDGSHACYLGPITARSSDFAAHLVHALIGYTDGQRVFWDIPNLNAAAVAQAKQLGFVAQRPLTRMCLGERTAPGDPHRQSAIAGPDCG